MENILIRFQPKLLVTYQYKAPSKKSGRRDNDCNGSQRLAAQRLGKADAASLPLSLSGFEQSQSFRPLSESVNTQAAVNRVYVTITERPIITRRNVVPSLPRTVRALNPFRFLRIRPAS